MKGNGSGVLDSQGLVVTSPAKRGRGDPRYLHLPAADEKKFVAWYQESENPAANLQIQGTIPRRTGGKRCCYLVPFASS